MKIHQNGSVLIVSLILLLIMTLIGVSSMNMTGLEERMSGNYRDHQLAFQAAEAALVEGEAWLENEALTMQDFFNSCTSANCFNPTCKNGLCFTGSFPVSAASVEDCQLDASEPWGTQSHWTTFTTSDKRHRKATALPGVAAQGRYIVEFRCFVVRDPGSPTPDPKNFYEWSPFFRVTALANGGTGDSQVMLQSTYKLNDF